jgi:hypothetical protein
LVFITISFTFLLSSSFPSLSLLLFCRLRGNVTGVRIGERVVE